MYITHSGDTQNFPYHSQSSPPSSQQISLPLYSSLALSGKERSQWQSREEMGPISTGWEDAGSQEPGTWDGAGAGPSNYDNPTASEQSVTQSFALVGFSLGFLATLCSWSLWREATSVLGPAPQQTSVLCRQLLSPVSCVTGRQELCSD